MERRSPTRTVLAVAAAAIAGAGLVGCGGQSHSGGGYARSMPAQGTPADIRPAAQAALKLWSSFPASASPRPIVLRGGTMIPPANGFASNDSKLAFIQGNFKLEAPLPTSPAHSHGYAIVPVGQALKTAGVAGPVLVITRVTLGMASFQTDRGFLELPAWKLYFRGGGEPAAVLALASEEIFTPPAVFRRRTSAVATVGSAAASPDERQITVAFVGGHAGSQPCDVNYSASVVTSAHAVAISVIPHPVATGPSVACTAIGYERHLPVDLGQPLGGRMLINGANGAVIPVVIGSDNPGVATSPQGSATGP